MTIAEGIKNNKEEDEDTDGCPYGYGCYVFGSLAMRCGHLVDGCPYLSETGEHNE